MTTSTGGLIEQFTPALGRTVYLRPGTSDEQAWSSFQTGRYHEPPADMPTPSSVVDIGSNIGLTAAHYKRMWPKARVRAIEPCWETFEMLTMNAPDCECQWFAVTDWKGRGWFDPTAPAEAISIQRKQVEGFDEVQCFTFADVLAGGAVDFAKVDSEGSEWGMFAQGEQWKDRCGSLLIELHPQNAPDPPSVPWPEGRDGPNPLLAAAVPLLEALGYQATPRLDHPASVFAVRR